MKLKLKEVIEIKNALDWIAQKEFSVKLNYASAKNLKKIKPFVDDFLEENKLRTEKLSQKDEKGQPIVIEGQIQFGDNLELATEDYKKLLDNDCEIDFYKVKIEEDKVPAAILLPLLDVIIEE